MNFLVAIIAWIVVAAAHPSPPITSSYNESEVIALGYTAQQKTADCQRGKNYCYAQIVKDLGMFLPSILSSSSQYIISNLCLLLASLYSV
jgi:hypothetical protein